MTQAPRKKKPLPPSNADAPQMMSLSLFIMLLAFFIVLNGMSSFDEMAARPVVESLSSAFSTEVRYEETAPSMKEDPVKSLHEGETIERIDALFTAQISGFETTKSKSRGIISVDVALDEFSKGIMRLNQKDLSIDRLPPTDGAFFLPTLVSILKSDERGRTYRMDMIYHVTGNPARLQNEEPQEVASMLERAGQITRRLQEAGMSQRLMSFSIEQGKTEQVTLTFAPHYPFDPSAGREEGF